MARFDRWALAALLLLVGCAKKGPPSGGPPDLDPPRVIAASPDSGAAGVARDARLSITFSEAMEPRSTGDAVALAPKVGIRQRRWSGHTLTLTLEDTLRSDQTYTMFVGNTALDRHNNRMRTGATIVFATGSSFPPGVIEGTMEPKGFEAEGTYLWGYREPREPDSTASDFDALGLVDRDGHFRIPGLVVPGRYRLWAFADLNGNRSLEPTSDVFAAAETTFSLTAEQPVASGIALRVINRNAPGKVRGTVIDSTRDSLGVLRVVAVFERDSTRRQVVDADPSGVFEFRDLEAGVWTFRAWRDRDRNRAWRVDLEPASPVERIELHPAEDVTDLHLRLRRTTESEPP